MMFTEPLAVKIVKGEKTATRRLVSDNPRSPWAPPVFTVPPGGGLREWRWRYPVGKVFTVNPGRGVGRIAECEVTARRVDQLHMVTPEGAVAEGFSTRPEFLAAFCSINVGCGLHASVQVVEFKLVGPNCRRCLDGKQWTMHGRTRIPRWCADCFGTGVEVSEAARELIAKVEA